MALMVKPMACNGGCRSCYEATIRAMRAVEHTDFSKVKETLSREMARDVKGDWSTPGLHGGEPLLMPLQEIEELLKIIFDKYGHTGVQTNGTLITNQLIDLFQKYKTNVGISLDGDTAELNRGRWNDRDGWDVQAMTDRVLAGMTQLKAAGIPMSIIVVLRKFNADLWHLPKLIQFLYRMRDESGIASIRLNPVMVTNPEWAKEEELDDEELGDAFRKLTDLALADQALDWRPMKDFISVLRGGDRVTCSFLGCDIWATNSETPIYMDGSLGNCLHGGSAIDGLTVIRADKPGNEREIVLPQVDQADGGCGGCFYWRYCHGGCPGSGLNNDWRNRTRFCSSMKNIFSYLMAKPIFLPCEPKQSNGNVNHGDSHGDKPHGDSWKS